MKLGSMAPELAKNEISLEGEIDDSLVKQLLTSIIIGLGEIFRWKIILLQQNFKPEERRQNLEMRLGKREKNSLKNMK